MACGNKSRLHHALNRTAYLSSTLGELKGNLWDQVYRGYSTPRRLKVTHPTAKGALDSCDVFYALVAYIFNN